MGCDSQGDEKPVDDEEKSLVRNFHFPLKRNTHLLTCWEKFVNREPDWKATPNTVVCSRHFERKFIKINERCATLDWQTNPIPSVYVNEQDKKHPSLMPTLVRMRKPPTKRNYQDDELPKFLKEVGPFVTNVFDLIWKNTRQNVQYSIDLNSLAMDFRVCARVSKSTRSCTLNCNSMEIPYRYLLGS